MESRAFASTSKRRVWRSMPSGVFSCPDDAARKSLSSGMLFHRKYERRPAVSYGRHFGSAPFSVRSRKFGDWSMASTTNCAPAMKLVEAVACLAKSFV